MENFTMKHLGYIVALIIVVVIGANIFTAIGAAHDKFEEEVTNTSIMKIITE